MESSKIEASSHIAFKERAISTIIFSEDSKTLETLIQTITQLNPGSRIAEAVCLDQLIIAVRNEVYELIIVDTEKSQKSARSIIQELKLLEYDPAIIVLSDSQDPVVVAAAIQAGCDRYLVKNDKWAEEIAPTIRHAIRLKRLDLENNVLVERLTEANKSLEEKNHRLDEFSATVAHDLRGLLAGITMRLDFVLDSNKQDLTPAVKDILEKTLKTGERLTEIVQATYELARIGRDAVVKRKIDLNHLIPEVITDMNLDQSYNIKIGVSELPPVWGNQGLLRRVFANLISNAVKYNDKSEIIINIGQRRIFEKSGVRYLDIFVADNGIGIDENRINKIFKMYWRDPETFKKYEGLGVGLSVVQRIVELHSGEVFVESEPGKYSRFIISLPMDETGS